MYRKAFFLAFAMTLTASGSPSFASSSFPLNSLQSMEACSAAGHVKDQYSLVETSDKDWSISCFDNNEVFRPVYTPEADAVIEI